MSRWTAQVPATKAGLTDSAIVTAKEGKAKLFMMV